MPARAVVQGAAGELLAGIAQARDWIATRGRFDNVGQRQRLLELYGEGAGAFERLARG
jgi:hypothetical protein